MKHTIFEGSDNFVSEQVYEILWDRSVNKIVCERNKDNKWEVMYYYE